MTSTRRRSYQSVMLIVALLSQLIVVSRSANAQQIKVTVGQPSIWSLEQAHYLLAQIRERNMGIRNPILSEADLDPNATNATRLDALRTLFEIGVSYDQRLGLTNSLNRQNLGFNQSRRQELFTRRSSLFDQKNRNLESLGRLRGELSAMEETTVNEETRNLKKREIQSLEDQNKTIDDQLGNLSREIELVGGGSDQLSSPSTQGGPGPFSDGLANRIGKAITDDFAKDAAKNPRLAATVKLDNYVQMQYELLAKQLTLLRDEVGPNHRLVFLELPTSIYAVPGRGDEWSAQSNWEVTGYYRENKYAKALSALAQRLTDLSAQLTSDIARTADPYEHIRLRKRYRVQQRAINREIANTERAFYEERAESLKHGGVVFAYPRDAGTGFRSINATSLFESGDISDLRTLAAKLNTWADPAPVYLKGLLSAPTRALLPTCATNPTNVCLNALINDLNSIISSPTNHWSSGNFGNVDVSQEAILLYSIGPTGDDLVAFNRLLIEDTFPREIKKRRNKEARVIDLIPRQSSLNVSDLKEIVKERGAKLVFSFLIGIGGSVNYQQRRERFEQFQQQEVYAAGYGKGESTFGWNFSPMPGTKRLAPGVRTTYAVLVVPRDAARIQIKATPRPFRTNQAPGESGTPTTFELDVPNGPGDEGFFVTRVDYPLVAVNQRSVVVLRGDFSSQTGILINGTPLVRAVGVANPWLGSEREKPLTNVSLGEPDTTIKGFYEVINANQVIMIFLMPRDFKGTPHITLVSPGRARSINDITMNINGEPWKRLKDYNDGYMIGAKAKDPETPLTIGDIEIAAERPAPGAAAAQGYVKANVNLKVAGSKNGTLRIFFNTAQVVPTPIGGGLYQFEVQLPLNRETVSIAITEGEEVDTKHYDNPAFAKFAVTQRHYDLADPEDPDDDSVTLVIEGRRIGDLEVTTDSASYAWQSRSFNQGILLISGLKGSPSLVKFTDRLTGEALAPIPIYRTKPKPKPKPGNSEGSGERRP